ncbi:MAG: DUF1385 domain-containing protein [Coriobacteriia bacterium]|nr:DUF1385 domain-containing protein [Coriobacteriia bacterium]
MMRGRYNWAVAVRTPAGEIHSEEHDLASGKDKADWMRWPIVRGVVAMVETLALALKAFEVSAGLMGETEEEKLTAKEISITMLIGVGMAILFFIVLPAVVTNFMVDQSTKPFLWNIVDGVLRVVAFFAYIWGIGRMSDIQRVFAYHGAEHKTIHAYEHDLPLETDLIQRYGTLHVRCGTSFLLMVMVIAIIVFSIVPVKAIALGLGFDSRMGQLVIAILARLLLMPLVAGIAYEVTVKWAGSHSENPFVKVLLWPGMQMQRMTTREPDDGMIEVAVAAMAPIIAREELERRRAAGEPIDDERGEEEALETSSEVGEELSEEAAEAMIEVLPEIL